MSERTPAPLAANAVELAQGPLTPAAIDAVLADFRSWLEQLGQEEPLPPESLAEPPVDLHTLLGQIIALKQEVNLQTRAVRAQQEQNAAGIEQLTTTLEKVRTQTVRPPEDRSTAAIDEAVRPLLQTLVDLYDAASLASRELERARQAAVVPPTNGQAVSSAEADTIFETQLQNLLTLANVPRGWFPPPRNSEAALRDCAAALRRAYQARIDSARQAQAQLLERTNRSAHQVDQVLDSVVTGFGMSLQRVERALQKHGLERIGEAGQPFDPERMEVVEVVRDSGRPNGEVLEVVRPGYLWKGRVFRYAQVRVAKSETLIQT